MRKKKEFKQFLTEVEYKNYISYISTYMGLKAKNTKLFVLVEMK